MCQSFPLKISWLDVTNEFNSCKMFSFEERLQTSQGNVLRQDEISVIAA